MGAKLLVLDCDGTIRQTKSGLIFINDPNDQQPINGAKEAVHKAYSNGWTIIGASNQGGVAKGYKSLESAIEEQQITLSFFPELKFILICPDNGETCYLVDRDRNTPPRKFRREEIMHPNMDLHLYQSFRKPGSGMLMLAHDLIEGEVEHAWVVSDRAEDQMAAAAANFQFSWADIWRNSNQSQIEVEGIEIYNNELCWRCGYNAAIPSLNGLCVSCVD